MTLGKTETKNYVVSIIVKNEPLADSVLAALSHCEDAGLIDFPFQIEMKENFVFK
tara:strand:+ start:130 stop:294 length:165 start_codon:yes stop_codon:yes gene_type:complete